MRKGTLALVILVALAMLLASCTTPTATSVPPTPTTTAAPDLGGREITVGSDTTYPPFEIPDKEGNIIGFDVDLVNAICEAVNCHATFVTTAWDGIWAALAADEFDIVASGATCTGSLGEERSQTVDFGDVYLTYGQVLLVRADEEEIKGPDDLEGHKVGAQVGTTNEASAIEFVGDENYSAYETFDLAIIALQNGDIDAVVIDSPAADGFIGVYPGELKKAGEPFTSEGLCIALQKGDTAMKDAMNYGLAQIKADGTLDDIVRYWFTEWKPEE